MSHIINGKLVVFEGVTGSGKTYFVRKLSKLLTEKFKIPIQRMGGFVERDDLELFLKIL